jgi:hypothetical protein
MAHPHSLSGSMKWKLFGRKRVRLNQKDKGTAQFKAILKVNKTMGITLGNASVCVGFKMATNKQMVIGC